MTLIWKNLKINSRFQMF